MYTWIIACRDRALVTSIGCTEDAFSHAVLLIDRLNFRSQVPSDLWIAVLIVDSGASRCD